MREVAASGLQAMPADRVPAVTEQVGENVRAGLRQRVGRRPLTVGAQRVFGSAPRPAIELRQTALEIATQAARQLVLDLEAAVDDRSAPAGARIARRRVLQLQAMLQDPAELA